MAPPSSGQAPTAHAPARSVAPPPAAAAASATVAGANVTDVIATEPLKTIWNGDLNGKLVSVHAFTARDRSPHEMQLFGLSAKRMLALANVPGMLRVHAVTDDGLAYVADPLPANRLSKFAQFAWTLDERVDVVRKLALTLHAAHGSGVAHGCLCPDNVFIDGSSTPYVTDLGAYSVALTFGGDVDGTYGYGPFASPEARAGQTLYAASDVYSLGRVMEFLLLGTPPDTKADANEAVPRLDEILRIVPAGIVRIIRKCVIADPAKRYPSAGKLAEDLERWRHHDLVGMKHPEAVDTNLTVDLRGGSMLPNQSPARGLAPPPIPIAIPGVQQQKPDEKKKTDDEDGKLKLKLDMPEFDWSVTSDRAALAALGLVAAVVAPVYVLKTGNDFEIPQIVGAIGTGLATLVAPNLVPSQKKLGRAILFLIGTVASAGVNPASFARDEALRRRKALATETIEPLRARDQFLTGRRVFTGVNLKGADLSDFDFGDIVVARSDFSEANFARSNLSRARITMTIFRESNIEAANLSGVAGEMLIGFESAHCDTRTLMPAGYQCADGHPAYAPIPIEQRRRETHDRVVEIPTIAENRERDPEGPKVPTDSVRGHFARTPGAMPIDRRTGAVAGGGSVPVGAATGTPGVGSPDDGPKFGAQGGGTGPKGIHEHTGGR